MGSLISKMFNIYCNAHWLDKYTNLKDPTDIELNNIKKLISNRDGYILYIQSIDKKLVKHASFIYNGNIYDLTIDGYPNETEAIEFILESLSKDNTEIVLIKPERGDLQRAIRKLKHTMTQYKIKPFGYDEVSRNCEYFVWNYLYEIPFRGQSDCLRLHGPPIPKMSEFFNSYDFERYNIRINL
jgi:hypothetical protein